MSTVIPNIPEETAELAGPTSLLLQMKPVIDMTEDQFFEFCQINGELRIERSANGELVIMSPTGGESGNREAELIMQLRIWAKKDGRGTAFNSNTGFTLPNKAIRAPDASWVSNTRLQAFTKDEREKFLPLCPEFVVEIRSPTDSIRALKAKLQEYIDNGAQLGLLIIPETKRVLIYQPHQEVRELTNCDTVSCDPVLPGFELVVKEVW